MVNQQLLNAVITLANKVGQYQISRFRTLPPGGEEEKVAKEFVSEVDINSEKLLYDGLKKLLPDAGFYGEESGMQGQTLLRWIVDPLDGTTNFLSGLDQFCISIALEHEHQIVLGVVLRPASNECFSALRGTGLFRNAQQCAHVPAGLLENSVIATGFPYRSPDVIPNFFSCANEVLHRSRDIRRFGAAALDLSYLAAGFIQGFWETDLQPYDVAAAILFLEEVGCTCTNQAGEPYSFYSDRLLVCGFPEVQQELCQLVAKHYPQKLTFNSSLSR
jgi:myo-inositol-1(or 4)-monophosphatase